MNRQIIERRDASRAPLRTFADDTHQTSNSVTTRLDLYWYLFAPVLAFVAIGCLGIVAAWAYYRDTPYEAPENSVQHSFCRGDGSINYTEFIDIYLEAKGLQQNKADNTKFRYRGAYARGNEMVGFTGGADLVGNVEAEMAWGVGRGVFAFGSDHNGVDISKLEREDRLAVRTLSAILIDPIVLYAQASQDYIIQMKLMEELGREVVSVELVNAHTSIRHSVIIDRRTMAIMEFQQVMPSGEEISLRMSSYRNVGGINLPHRISGSSGNGHILPIELTQLHRL